MKPQSSVLICASVRFRMSLPAYGYIGSPATTGAVSWQWTGLTARLCVMTSTPSLVTPVSVSSVVTCRSSAYWNAGSVFSGR